jgi:DDE superfamily endonuclease
MLSRATGMFAASAKGKVEPGFWIIKCTAQGPNYAKSSVLKNLVAKADDPFRRRGWEQKWWTEDIAVPKSKSLPAGLHKFKIPYLIDRDGNIITIQESAWMDTARACMWLDLVVWRQLSNCGKIKRLVIWDNCGSHCTEGLVEYIKHKLPNVFVKFLPENTSDFMQVMDLVFNGPLKVVIRKGRASFIELEFREWRERVSRQEDQFKSIADIPPFCPQPSHISAGIQLALDFISDCNLTQGGKLSQMACGLREAFVKTGVVADESGAYSRGVAHRMARADELSRKQWSPETLDLLVGVNIDVSAMEEDEPDATEESEDDEASDQEEEVILID